MFGLIIILILHNLVIWQKKLLEIKDKKIYIYFVEEIKNRWSNLKGKTEKTPGDEKENEREKKY